MNETATLIAILFHLMNTAGARLGKSGAALVQQMLVIAFGSIVQGAPLLALLFYVVIFVWTGERLLYVSDCSCYILTSVLHCIH